ncbi:MAG TPA: hypothetical protein PLP89_05445 [Synergistales bacterium]|nr:hypothetical protein [Synergistales bacterium]HRV71101.1 hypothetical protein [Thermovirgaceae bacterium]
MMEKCIEKVIASLEWELEEIETGDEIPGISSDPVKKRHCLSLSPETSKNGMDYLVFLCHASLAERVHPLFSSLLVESGDLLPENVFLETVWPALCLSRIWFADAMAYDLFPDGGLARTEARLRGIEELFPGGRLDGSVSDLAEMALVFAEGNVLCGLKQEFGGKMEEMVAAFSEADPRQPTLDALLSLNNRLLSVWTPFRVEVAFSKELGMELWKVL